MYKLKKLTCHVQVMQHVLELLWIQLLHDKGSDRVGHAHDAQERYGGAQLLVGVDEVEGLLCAPLHPKTEKEGEEGQDSCVHHLGWQNMRQNKIFCQTWKPRQRVRNLAQFAHPAKLLCERQLLLWLLDLHLGGVDVELDQTIFSWMLASTQETNF